MIEANANLTPLSLPSSPCPKKGTITPGESAAYNGILFDNFNRFETFFVWPGNADVLSGFFAPVRSIVGTD